MTRTLKLLLALFALTTALDADSFNEAVAVYEKGEYEAAAKKFERVAAEDETAATRHNLALSYFQLGQSGDAAWQIERALRIEPLNKEYHYKLGALRQQIGLFESRPNWYILGAQLLPAKAWILIACASFWLLLAASILPRMGGLPVELSIKSLRILSTLLLLLALPALWIHHSLNQNGVVVSNSPVDLHAAPASAAPASGIARPGERARIIDQHHEFYKVETEGQANGWISKEAFRSLEM